MHFNLTSNYKNISELCDIIRLFHPSAVFSEQGERLELFYSVENGNVKTIIEYRGGQFLGEFPLFSEADKYIKRALKNALYDFFSHLTGEKKEWGSLTGIRPTALAYELLARGVKLEKIPAELIKEFRLSEAKAALVAEIVAAQREYYIKDSPLINLYINIPVCPSRCSYCSFISHEYSRCGAKLLSEYLEYLKKEVVFARELAVKLGKRFRAVYIGGGTPGILSAEQIRFLGEILPEVSEVTFEIGRPDTVTEAKLDALKDIGATRICINPQTLNDNTLKLIGRNHTAVQFFEAFELARKYSFDINTDLIAGLPNENAGTLIDSVSGVAALSPENITVHTLALKAGSRIKEDSGLDSVLYTYDFSAAPVYETLKSAGYIPYYLYRQKYMLNGLENIGYAKPNKQCLYNIDTMEETLGVLACGAGAISKAVFSGGRIERAANFKNIGEYIGRFNEVLDRKRKLMEK